MPVLFVALGLFGVIGALFGPVKYGILPDQLQPEELSAGNALVEGATFLAILGGTILAGFVVGATARPHASCRRLDLGLAVFVLAFGHADPEDRRRPRPTSPSRGIRWSSTWRCSANSRPTAACGSAAHIVSWFWAVGGVALSLLPTLIKDRLGGNETVLSLAIARVHDRHRRSARSLPPAPASIARIWRWCRRRVADGDRHRQDRRCRAQLPARMRSGRHRSVRGDFVSSLSGAAAAGRCCWRWHSPAASTSCRRSPPCRAGHRPTAARASSPPSTS